MQRGGGGTSLVVLFLIDDEASSRENPSSPLARAPKQPRAAARQEPDLAYSEAAGLKRGRVRPPRELVYAADASPGSRGTIIAAIFIRCPAQGTLLTFGLFNATSDRPQGIPESYS